MSQLKELHLSAVKNNDTAQHFVVEQTHDENNVSVRGKIQDCQASMTILNNEFVDGRKLDGWTFMKYVTFDHLPYPKERAIFKIDSRHPNSGSVKSNQEAKYHNIKPPVKSLFGRIIGGV